MSRDSAGVFELKGGTGGITYTCVVDGYLEMYKVDKTFRVKSPESLDPERLNPNMPWAISEYSDVGSSNKVVARLLIQSIEMFKAAIFSRKIEKDRVISLLHDTKEHILICESVADKLEIDVSAIEKIINESKIEMDERKRSINPFPQFKKLNEECIRFLTSAKRCVQNYAVLTDLFYETGIGLPRFDKIITWAKNNLGEDSYLFSYASHNEPRLRRIVDLRNYQEHPVGAKKTHFENYTLLPDMTIRAPVWYITGESPSPIREEMRAIANYLFDFGERLFLSSFYESLSKNIPYFIYEEQAENIKDDCPIRYRLSIDTSKFTLS